MTSREPGAPIMVGAFPPPVHGMAAVNSAVLAELRSHGVEPAVVDLASASLDRSVAVRLRRIPTVLRGLTQFWVLAKKRRPLYMNVSGGYGQLYELAFLVLARIRGVRIFLHHHCSSYLDSKSWIAALFTAVAGRETLHIVQSPVLGHRLASRYGVARVAAVSNAVFLLGAADTYPSVRPRLRSIGFISNICAEKGIFDYLDLMDAAAKQAIPVVGKIAGPFQDKRTEREVLGRLRALPNVSYLGPIYGADKEAFFREIDLFVFPTRYANETEGIVNHEAMSWGAPVIAFGRGAIPEIVDESCGRVIDPSDPFVPAALAQIQAWLREPGVFEKASAAAPRKFAETHSKSNATWSAVFAELTGRAGR